ncbi:MAG: hypothetical protein QM734_15170 [Cyclobacteriaceae bacterium]
MRIDKLNRIGWWIYAPFLLLTLRLTWEKIFLTWTQGQQNIGFSLAHGVFGLLFLAPLFSLIWTIVMTIQFFFRDKQDNNKKGTMDPVDDYDRDMDNSLYPL